MAGSVNKVILIGNLGRDPEIRSTNDGQRIANFSLATSEQWRDKASGERREKTEWHRVVIFNERLVDVVDKYVKKGRKLYVEGSLQTRKWNDNQGQERYTTEIVVGRFNGDIQLLDSAGSGGAAAYEPQGESSFAGGPNGDYGGGGGYQRGGATAGGGTGRPPPRDLDDEIPF